jgi:hypothetical protein
MPGLKTQAQLEAEIVISRHQLYVLRRRVPSKPKLTVATNYSSSGILRVSVKG